MSNDMWFNTTQVARMLSVSPNHVRNLISGGHFDEVRDIGTGKRSYYKVSKGSVNRYIQEHSTHSTLNA